MENGKSSSLGVSGLGQERPGPLGIIAVSVKIWIVSRRAWWENAVCDNESVLVDPFDDGILVDGVADGLAHETVVEWLLSHVDADESEPKHGALKELILLSPHNTAALARRDRAVLEASGLELFEHQIKLLALEDAVHHAVQIRTALGVVMVRFENDFLALPTEKFERSSADR